MSRTAVHYNLSAFVIDDKMNPIIEFRKAGALQSMNGEAINLSYSASIGCWQLQSM